jgi:vitamin B12 transporter
MMLGRVRSIAYFGKYSRERERTLNVKKQFLKLLWLAAVLAVPVTSSWADDVDLDRIVVTPTGITEYPTDVGRVIDVITSEDIRQSHATDLAEVLTGLTSINVIDNGGAGAQKTVRMRGSTANQTLVLMDGRPLNSPRDGEIDISTIALENIQRIEVVHGPGSSLYGSNSMAGTINIITKNPPRDGHKAVATTAFGTFRTYTERFSYGARRGKLGYLFTGDYVNSAGFRKNAEANAGNYDGKLLFDLNDRHHLTLHSGFRKSRQGTPGSIVDADTDDKQNNRRNYVDLDWEAKFDEQTGASLKIYQNYDRLEFLENTAGSIFDVANDKFVHTTKSRGFNLQANRSFTEAYEAVAGFNYVAHYNNSTSSAKHKYAIIAGYLENKWNPTEKLRVDISARLDDYSNFGLHTSPSWGLNYALRDNVKIHGLVGQSFRAPTFNDLYWPDQGWAKGNPSLSPEEGTTAEAGIETKINKHLSSGLTNYWSHYDNLINWADIGGVWQPINVTAAVINGIECKNTITLTDHLGIGANYTYLKAQNAKTHNDLIYQPRHKLDLSLTARDLKDFTVQLRGQFTGTRFNDVANTVKVKQFFVLGMSASKKMGHGITVFLSIDNMLNKKYVVTKDFPMPGFDLTSGVKIEF